MTIPAGALAVYAHPDDAEIPSRGTLAAWTAGGSQVDLPVLTRGERGSSRPAAAHPDGTGRRVLRKVTGGRTERAPHNSQPARQPG